MRVISQSTHTARKVQSCWWCREKIQPGERYTKQVQVDGRYFDAILMHVDCDAAWHRWWNFDNPDGYEEALDPWCSDDRPVRGSWRGEEAPHADRE